MSARDVVASEVIPREVIEDAVVKAFTNKGHEFYRAVEQSEDIVPVILSALTAAGLVVEQGWQDIATAPRDGTRALFYAPGAGGDYSEPRQRVDWWREGGWWQMRPIQPYTAWRPLPAPPAAQEPQG